MKQKHKEIKLDFDRPLFCIEAYPRSANSFACHMLSPLLDNFYSEKLGSRFIHRTHDLAVVKLMINNKIPTMIVIRNPKDAIVSLYLYHKGKIKLELLINKWVNFYGCLLPNIPNNVLLVSFECVTQNFNEVVEKVNLKFGFHLNVLTDVNSAVKIAQEKSVVNSQTKHGDNSVFRSGTPDQTRECLKEEVKELLTLHSEYLKAVKIYKELQFLLF